MQLKPSADKKGGDKKEKLIETKEDPFETGKWIKLKNKIMIEC